MHLDRQVKVEMVVKLFYFFHNTDGQSQDYVQIPYFLISNQIHHNKYIEYKIHQHYNIKYYSQQNNQYYNVFQLVMNSNSLILMLPKRQNISNYTYDIIFIHKIYLWWNNFKVILLIIFILLLRKLFFFICFIVF